MCNHLTLGYEKRKGEQSISFCQEIVYKCYHDYLSVWVLFIPLCGSTFPSGVTFFLPEGFPLTFLVVPNYWGWVYPAFICPKRSIFVFIFGSFFFFSPPGYRIPGWQFFPRSSLKILNHLILTCLVSENSCPFNLFSFVCNVSIFSDCF